MQNDTGSLRRSDRLASHSTNQPYKSMQGRHRRAGRVKRQKLGSDGSVINESATNKSAINGCANYDPVIDSSVMIESTFCDFRVVSFTLPVISSS